MWRFPLSWHTHGYCHKNENGFGARHCMQGHSIGLFQANLRSCPGTIAVDRTLLSPSKLLPFQLPYRCIMKNRLTLWNLKHLIKIALSPFLVLFQLKGKTKDTLSFFFTTISTVELLVILSNPAFEFQSWPHESCSCFDALILSRLHALLISH